jgi:hypothetical protein
MDFADPPRHKGQMGTAAPSSEALKSSSGSGTPSRRPWGDGAPTDSINSSNYAPRKASGIPEPRPGQRKCMKTQARIGLLYGGGGSDEKEHAGRVSRAHSAVHDGIAV